jgi:hypothetical protein
MASYPGSTITSYWKLYVSVFIRDIRPTIPLWTEHSAWLPTKKIDVSNKQNFNLFYWFKFLFLISANYINCINCILLIYIAIISRSLNSSVGIAAGYVLKGPDSISGNENCFSSPQRPDQYWGPPSHLSNGYRGFSSGVKRQGNEADKPPSSSAYDQESWSCNSTLLYVFMA